MRQRLTLKAKELQLDHVHFHGSLPKAEIYQICQNADVLLESKQDTNLYRWGFSFNKLYDYFACQKPIVIGIRSPYKPVEESGAGFNTTPEDPAEFADAILKLRAMGVEGRRQIGIRGFDYVNKHHNFDNLAARLAEIINETCSTVGSTKFSRRPEHC